MTEEQAKTKWCPFVRTTARYRIPSGRDAAFVPINRTEEGGAVGPCIASDCMAWRWDPDGGREGAEYRDGKMVNAGRPYEGFCGLAGRL